MKNGPWNQIHTISTQTTNQHEPESLKKWNPQIQWNSSKLNPQNPFAIFTNSPFESSSKSLPNTCKSKNPFPTPDFQKTTHQNNLSIFKTTFHAFPKKHTQPPKMKTQMKIIISSCTEDPISNPQSEQKIAPIKYIKITI